MSGGNPVLSIDTVHGWLYQLLEDPSLQDFMPLGDPFPGDGTIQEIEIIGAPYDRDFFQWQISRE